MIDEFTVFERRFLRVHPNLEDVAGNKADVPFELFVNPNVCFPLKC